MIKAKYTSQWLIPTVAALLAPVYFLVTGIQTFADIPSAAIVTVLHGDRNNIQIGPGTDRQTKPIDGNQGSNHLGRYEKVLYVLGDNISAASLTFVEGNVWEYGGLYVQTIPSIEIAEYRYPCQFRGNLTIGFRYYGDSRDRSCNQGATVGPSKNLNVLSPSPSSWNLAQANKSLLTAQANDEVVVVPGQEQTIIQTRDTGNGIAVDVVLGEVNIQSAKNPDGRTVRAGEKYSYPQDTITPIDRNAILNSPSMQDFLNPNHWSSPDIPQRVSDDMAEQLGQHRAALGLPPIASGFLRVVSGTGRITHSDYPNVVPVGTSVSQVSGGYDSSTRKIVLEIEGKQAEISLNAPLTDGTPILFTVNQIIPRSIRDNSYENNSHFPSLVKEAWVKAGIESQGTLIKEGNQIRGQFTAQGRWRVRGRTLGRTGSVNGEFVLTLLPGASSDIPRLRNYTATEWNESPDGSDGVFAGW